jgi:DNA phosphorothioation-dependent restriction protein DptG
MAHFAKLGVGNIVEQIIVVSNDIATTEQAGVDFINKLYNTRDVWKQTSYNNNIRKNFAGIGYQYNQQLDAFISPKPFNSWILNETTCQWESSIPKPQDGNYIWNENTLTWDSET